jgi:TonB family protein
MMIGQAMLYTVGVGVPIVLAAMTGAGYLRRHGRTERWVWTLGLVLAFGVPLAMVSREPAAVEAEGPPVATDVLPAPVAGSSEAGALVDPGLPLVGEPASSIDLDPLLLTLWLLASALLALRWGVSCFRLAALSRRWRPATIDGDEVLETDGMGPAVAGVFRPRILVPSWVRSMPARERQLVLLHEREHVRAGDHLLVGLCRLARVVAPWNPVVWLITSRLGRALELDCDRRVLRRQPDVRAYGATLLTISERTSGRPLAAAAFAESDVPLRRRILSMTTPPRPLRATGVLGILGVGAALLVGAVSVPAPEVRLPWTTPVVWKAVLQRSEGLPPLRVIPDPVTPARVAWVLRSPGAQGDSVVRLTTTANVAPALLRSVALDLFGDTAGLTITYDQSLPGETPPEVTDQPRILNPEEIVAAMAAAYPEQLRDRGLGGTVGMQFRLDERGVVTRTRIGQISAYPAFDEAALRVARLYRFSPAVLDGQPTAVWVSHAIDFRVE